MLLTMLLLFLVYAGFFSLGLLIHVPLAVVVGLAVAGLLIHLLNSQWIMRKALGPQVRPVESVPAAADLKTLVDRVAMQAGVRAPKVMVMENAVANACALGTSPKRGTILFTKGLLALDLTPEEMEAVAAHELSHLIHRDTVVMIAATTFTALAALIGRSIGHLMTSISWSGGSGSWFGGSSGDGDGDGGGDGKGAGMIAVIGAIVLIVIVVAVALTLNYLLTRLLSRYRELAADRGAAIITGHPAALGGALVRIQAGMSRARDVDLRALQPASALMLASLHADPKADLRRPAQEAGWALLLAAACGAAGLVLLLIDWYLYNTNDPWLLLSGPITVLALLAGVLAIPAAAVFYLWHRFVPNRDLVDVVTEFFATHPSYWHRLKELRELERTMDGGYPLTH
jgi:heat shock protein HtpX